jgi:hypothetical protein
MQEVIPERQRRRTGPKAASDQGSQPTSILGFLDGVLSDEDKTWRLAYLVRQLGFVAVVILISLAAVGYIWMHKAPMQVKAGVGGGSTIFIVLGSLAVRIKRAARRGQASRSGRSAIPAPLSQQLESGVDSGIGQSDSTDGQHTSNDDPYDDQGSAAQS